MQKTQNAICLICTTRTFKNTISKLISFKQRTDNNYFVLLLDEPGHIDNQNKTTPNIVNILQPSEIGLNETEWKMIVFINNCSKASLAIMPHLSAYLRKKNYLNIEYFDLHWKDNDYFYKYYSDQTVISELDRIKFSNMHPLEKRTLGDPFSKKNEIRNIKQIIGQNKTDKKLFLKLNSSRDGSEFLKKYQLGMDNLMAQVNFSVLIRLSFYVAYKIIMRIIANSALFLTGKNNKSNNLGIH